MSAVREVIQFETHIHGQVHANAWTNMDAAQPSQTRPSTENDLPFVLVALEDVRVKSGVMHGEVMQSAHDLVEGDAWSMMGLTNMTPADTRLESGQLRILLSTNVEVGRKSISVVAPVDLTLMSDCGKMLMCQHIEERDSGHLGRSFLLLPARFDAGRSYELISKGA